MSRTPEPPSLWKRIRWFAWKMGRALKLAAWAFTIDVRRGWAWLLVTGAILGPAFLLSGSLDTYLRYAGYILEVLGIGTVAWGLRDRARHHRKPGLLEPLGDRLRAASKEFASAFRGPQAITGVAGSVTAGVSTVGGATVRTSVPPGASLEYRIARLEGKVDGLQEQSDRLRREVEEKHRKALGAVEQERTAREEDTAALREKVAQVDTGGLHIEWMGVWWLVLGVTLATLAPELAGLWHAL